MTAPRFIAPDDVRTQRLPFEVLGLQLGWVEADIAEWLLARSSAFQRRAGSLTLQVASFAEAGETLRTLAPDMRDAGLIRGWRNEAYTCFAPSADGDLDLARPLFELERAAFRRFGLTSRAVHINGYTASGDMWIGRRAAHKAIDPSLLDNLAAGGISAGETPDACVIRELFEEAGVPEEIATRAVACGAIRTTRCEHDGTHDEVIHCFDLLLPDDFTPANQDGEVSGFQRIARGALPAHLANMTPDAAAVTRDFLRRHTA
ncbi:NUDIX domain-containing protein [Niveibacterium umoris]|uniref:8-oxo-dGTP pyrophosphatase MutT (NUDIX family) n=1 Tax=Niveibacterium umoris TaxID=1193620 RepID=A0A840BKV7_9RHOO|nr:DUF4743 domain-containing protein [Niveibacterium umoris]MBB4013885.1 8-oxo-dGTP pyrophosphatase MutT (NUDIX family) [Niveibacterium umoris]